MDYKSSNSSLHREINQIEHEIASLDVKSKSKNLQLKRLQDKAEYMVADAQSIIKEKNSLLELHISKEDILRALENRGIELSRQEGQLSQNKHSTQAAIDSIDREVTVAKTKVRELEDEKAQHQHEFGQLKRFCERLELENKKLV